MNINDKGGSFLTLNFSQESSEDSPFSVVLVLFSEITQCVTLYKTSKLTFSYSLQFYTYLC